MEEFYDLVNKNRMQFNLLCHTKTSKDETLVEVRADGKRIIRIIADEYEEAFQKARVDLEHYLEEQWEQMTMMLKEGIAI